jgi:hypothetical protein
MQPQHPTVHADKSKQVTRSMGIVRNQLVRRIRLNAEEQKLCVHPTAPVVEFGVL